MAAITTTTLVSSVLPRPQAALATVGRLLCLVVVSVAAYNLASHLARRLVPLSALYRMSLVFPDNAPSRFAVALRTGTTRELERTLSALADDEDPPAPVDAAAMLIGLVRQLTDHERLTRGHSERVRAYSDLIAEEMSLPDSDRERLHWAALLHDIGKLEVPSAVLSKPGRPDEDEWTLIKQHPTKSKQFLRGMESWLGEWTLAASQHHERWDGTGYPEGLRGDEISLAGRIVSVADAYDVMTSARSYKKAMSPEVARQELIANSGSQFDPTVVRAFMNVGL